MVCRLLSAAVLLTLLLSRATHAVVVDVALVPLSGSPGSTLLVGNVSQGGVPLLTIRQPVTILANESTLTTSDGTLVLLARREGSQRRRLAPANCGDMVLNTSFDFGAPNETTGVVAVDVVACPTACAAHCGHCPAYITTRMLTTVTASTAHGTSNVLINVPSFATAAAADTRMSIWHGLWPIRYECDLPESDPLECFGAVRPSRHDGPVAFTSTDATVFVGPISDPLNTLYVLGRGGGRDDQVAADSQPQQLVAFGPSSSLAVLPQGHETTVGIVAGRGHFGNRPSLRDLAVAFGKLQRLYWYHNASSDDVERLPDAMVTRLSYWTGNGDFYYYNREGHAVLPANAGATLARVVDVINGDVAAFNAQRNLTSVPLPTAFTVVDSMQLDGWWSNSSSMFPDASMFPEPPASYTAMRNKTRGVLLYKCWFAKHFPLYKTFPMAPGNGGYPDPRVAKDFFAAVFALGETSYLGMTAYEIDFMSNRILDDPGLNSDLSNGLLQFHRGLADAALERRMPTLFCMPSAGQALFAALAPAVTHIRVSVDYQEQDAADAGWAPTYLLGGPGILIAASPTLRAFKDSTWTTAEQPGCPYPACTKPTVAMDVTLAALSTGPVGIGDKLKATNVTLLAMAVSTMSGRILQPSAPLASVTRSAGSAERLKRPAPLADCPDAHTNPVSRRCEPELATTYACALEDEASCRAAASSGQPVDAATPVVYHVFAVQLGAPFTLQIALGDLFPHPPLDIGSSGRRSFLRRQGGLFGDFAMAAACRHGADAVASGCVELYNWTHDVPDLSTGNSYREQEVRGAPAWGHFTIFSEAAGSGGWTFLGEVATKVVPVAPARFAAVACSAAVHGCQFRFALLEAADGPAAAFEVVTVGAVGPTGIYFQSQHMYGNCTGNMCVVGA